MSHKRSNHTPVLLLDGEENAVSIVRSLGRQGIPVSISGVSRNPAFRSRFCHNRYPVPAGVSENGFWGELLLGGKNSVPQGSVIFPCSDVAIEFLADNKDKLAKLFLLDDFTPEIHKAMLDKQKTLELARTVGVPTPNFWNVETLDDLSGIKDEITFPVMIKPIHSHLFFRHYGRKLFIVRSFADLLERMKDVVARQVDVMVCEMVPGPDNLLCSYYTYIDKSGEPLFHFTKRIIRRYPVTSGGATYHITEWIPETAELGLRFFSGINYRGLGNIEFKRDLRDGNLKVIEVNARFTAAQELLLRSGMDIAYVLYSYITGGAIPRPDKYEQFIRLWHPWRDFRAFLELHDRDNLGFFGWLRGIMHRQVFPFFSVRDPMPVIMMSYNTFCEQLRRRWSNWMAKL